MPDDARHEPPKKSKGDAAHAVARAALGAIPVAGSAAVELFTSIVTPPLEKRRDEWMRNVGEALQDLQGKKGVDPNDLKNNDVFVDTLLQASQAALRTSQEEKREALRNAVLHAALPNPPDQSLQQMFLNWVDDLTVWHLRILNLFHDPPTWFAQAGQKPPDLYTGSLSAVLEAAFPELRGQRGFYDQVWDDLYQRGLTNTDGLHTTMTGAGTLARRTTDLAARFLGFIRAPSQVP